MTGSMLRAEYTQDMHDFKSLLSQMNTCWTKNGRYSENHELITNVALYCINQMPNCMNQTEIEHDYFSRFGRY